jgi:hypothetical protein
MQTITEEGGKELIHFIFSELLSHFIKQGIYDKI